MPVICTHSSAPLQFPVQTICLVGGWWLGVGGGGAEWGGHAIFGVGMTGLGGSKAVDVGRRVRT